MHSEELKIVMWKLLFDGKEDEQTVALGEVELNNEKILMEGNQYYFKLSFKGAVIGEEIEEMRKNGDD